MGNFNAVGPVKVFFSYSVVAIAAPVLDDVTFALVKFPVADQAGSFGIDIVHIVPNFLFAAGYRPDTHFGNIAVELARVVIRLAEEELAEITPVLVVLIRFRVLQVEIVEGAPRKVERCRGRISEIGASALELAVDVDADLARSIAVSGGNVVPLPGIEQFRLVLLGEFPEARGLSCIARTVELNLLAWE